MTQLVIYVYIWFHLYLLLVHAIYILTLKSHAALAPLCGSKFWVDPPFLNTAFRRALPIQVLYRLTLQHRFLFMEGKGSVYTLQMNEFRNI